MSELLRISDLTVRFYTYDGIVKALEGVNFEINQGETFGLVGETGCGKTLTALSILRLVSSPGKIEQGSIYFHPGDRDEPIDLLTISENDIRDIRGSQISMVFQEPSAALDPVYNIGDQISEVTLLHRRSELSDQALQTINTLLSSQHGFPKMLMAPIRLAERSLYRRIAQNPRSFWPRFVSRIPLLNRLLWRLKDEARKLAIQMLREVEIPDPGRVIRQYPHQLSGGMKQRCVIAMALACSPRLLIADEPTTALDVTIQAQILELMRRLKVERQSSILYITHDLAVAAEICDRVGVMYAGNLCEVATVDELYTNPLHPYTKALIAAVPKPGKEPLPIGGVVPDPINPPEGCRFHPRCDRSNETCFGQSPRMHEVTPGHFVACHL